MDMGSIRAPYVSKINLQVGGVGISSSKRYSSDKFTGGLLLSCYLFAGSDISVGLANFEVTNRNAQVFAVFNGGIVPAIVPDPMAVCVVLACESTAFVFTMMQLLQNAAGHRKKRLIQNARGTLNHFSGRFLCKIQ